MADAATMRAVLREAGHTLSDRGRLGADMVAEYERIAGGDGPDYDGGVTDADFGGPDDDDLTVADFPGPADSGEAEQPGEGPAAPPSPKQREARPRRVRTSRPTGRDRLRAIQGRVVAGKGKPGKGRKKHPRVPVDRLIGRGYETLGRVFMRVSLPIGRCIQWQAPSAGLILEDAVRDTFVDRALQPIARAEHKAEAVAALAGPPVLIGMLQAAQGLPAEQRAMREAFIVPMLREAIALNIRVSGDQMEKMMQREQEEGPIYEQADRIMAGLFAPPSEPPSADDQAAAAAQAMMAPA